MRKFLLAAAFLALTPAFAQAHAGPAPGPARMQALHRDVVQDRREVRAERRDVREERRDVRQSRHHLRHLPASPILRDDCLMVNASRTVRAQYLWQADIFLRHVLKNRQRILCRLRAVRRHSHP